jgi:glutathione-regulated potassium-efflux system ancillary protein KefC
VDVILLAVAFVFGFAARQVGLPPLVGFLAAGFVLKALDVEGGAVLVTVGELGVTLLLFSIGLKLQVRTLLRPQVWAVASIHMLVVVVVSGFLIYGLAAAGLHLFAGMDLAASLLVGFALSFSSTVFAVRVLEEKGEMAASHGRIAIGILIVQDLAAVVFLAISAGKIPSPWALLLLGLIPLRPVLMMLMNRSGHGELLILYGLLVAIGGAIFFEAVGLKGDLGALILGVLIANHPKASELSRHLLGFKDLFLVGFFLSIGMAAAPTLETLGIAIVMSLAVVLKVALFFALFTALRMRARTSLLASLGLANYSEFGLIVGTIATKNGWLAPEWLVVMAIAISVTFVLASPLNAAAHELYARFGHRLRRFESPRCLPEDEPIDTGDAEILVFGMGRVGTGAYDAMRGRYGRVVLGLDADPTTVSAHQSQGRKVIYGDATDADFWEKLRPGKVRMVMLAMPSHTENRAAAERLAASGYDGLTAATARYADEIADLQELGVDAAFNIYAEAGLGFADHVCAKFNP